MWVDREVCGRRGWYMGRGKCVGGEGGVWEVVGRGMRGGTFMFVG